MTTTIDRLLNDGRVVTYARVVVHTTGPLGSNTPMSDNHWSIYLLLEAGGSLRLNMRADWDDDAEAWDTTGILDCSTHTYIQSNSSIGYWDYPVPNTTVGQICTLLWNKEYDAYEMSGGGSGCRYWVYSVIRLLENNRYASPGSASNLWPSLLFRYSKSGERRDLPMVQGSFYETSRFAESSTQNTTTTTPPATAPPVASGSLPTAYQISIPTTTVTTPSGSSEAAPPYYFVEGGRYFYRTAGQTTEVDRPKNVWVKNERGWADTQREKLWRYWNGKNVYYE